MEKYRVFADESVGVNPFIPAACMQAQLTPAIGLASRIHMIFFKGVRCLVAAVLLPLRCSLLLIAALMLLLLQLLLLPLLPFKYIHWRAALLLQRPPLRLALFGLGILHIQEQRADFRRLKIRAPTRSHGAPPPPPAGGGSSSSRRGGGRGNSSSSSSSDGGGPATTTTPTHPWCSVVSLCCSPASSSSSSCSSFFFFSPINSRKSSSHSRSNSSSMNSNSTSSSSIRVTNAAAEQKHQISKCCICLCSFTSLVEPLYAAYRLSPRFALLHAQGGFSFASLSQVLLYSLQFDLPAGRGRYVNLSELLAAHAATSSPCIPVVLFPEGQKSNGQCLLAWQQAMSVEGTAAGGGAGAGGDGDAAAAAGRRIVSSPGRNEEDIKKRGSINKSFDEAALRLLDGRIAELGCMYTAEDTNTEIRSKFKRTRVPYGLPHTVYSPTRHLCYALAEWSHPLLAVWATPEDVQACVQQQLQAAATGRSSSLGGVGIPSTDNTLLMLREVMVRMLPGRTPVMKSGADLASFSKYWEETQREQYLKTQ